jgi:DNA repair exonuclease SbcCD ATPase subunit
MLLKRLEIRNMRKIKQADVEFHGPGPQVIQGANKAGKSTLAQSIALTLEGPKAFNPGMITHGEEQAEIIAYTDDGLQIKTTIRNSAKDSVKQTVSRFDEGMGRYVNLSGGVRTFLDSIRSGLEMPWALRSMTDAKIIEILKDRAGVCEKIAQIDLDIKDKETARTEVGRDKKKIGELKPVPEVKHPPAIEELKAEREQAAEYLKVYRDALDKAADYIRSKCVFTAIEDIPAMKKVIEDTTKRVTEIMAGAGKPYTKAGLDEMDRKFIDWSQEEEKAKAWDSYVEKKTEFENLEKQYEALTQEIEELRDSRKKTLSGITLIKGLEIGEDNMLYNRGTLRGITETQKNDNWSTAESVQVFFSIGAYFAGKMKVLVVDNAESLDKETTGIISNWAGKNQFLVILLKVADLPEELEEGIIYLKEGEVLTA